MLCACYPCVGALLNLFIGEGFGCFGGVCGMTIEVIIQIIQLGCEMVI